MSTRNTVLTRRRWLRTAALAGAGLLASACQPKVVEKPVKETVVVEKVVKETVPPPTEAAPKPVSISLCVHSVQTVLDCHERHIQWYQEQNPHVRITLTSYPQMEMAQRLLTAWSAGVGDILCGIPGPLFATFAKGGYLDEAPPDVVDFLKQDFYDVNIRGGTFDGKLYTLVEEVSILPPIYSTDVWDAAGIPESEYPQTYEELIALLPRFPEGVQGICLAMGPFAVPNWITVLRAYGANVLDETGSKAAFNTPAGLEATRIWQAIVPQDSQPRLFLDRQCGMIWMGPWWRTSFSDPKMPVKVGPLLRGSVRAAVVGYQWDYVVSKQAAPEQKAVAWDYAKYVSTRQAQIVFWQEVGHMPRSRSAYEDPILKKDDFLQSFAKYMPEAENFYTIIPEWGAVETYLIGELTRLKAREVTPEQFLEDAEKRVNDILAGK